MISREDGDRSADDRLEEAEGLIERQIDYEIEHRIGPDQIVAAVVIDGRVDDPSQILRAVKPYEMAGWTVQIKHFYEGDSQGWLILLWGGPIAETSK